MKVLVLYYSESGNTEKVAKGLVEGLKTKDKELKTVQAVDSLNGYDVIFFGFPVLEHSVPPAVQSVLKKVPEKTPVAFFATHGSFREGVKANTAFETAGALVSSARVLGTFGVRGKVKSEVLESLEKRPEHQSWVEEAVSAVDHPNESDLADIAEFGNKMVEKVKRGKAA